MMLRLLLVMMGLALLPITAWGETRSFRDWAAECDEQLSCKAVIDNRGDTEMLLVRHGYEGAAWQLLFRFKNVTPPDATEVGAVVDGETVQFSSTAGFHLYYDQITVGVAGGEDLDNLFGKIRKGKELKLAYDSSRTTEKKEPHEVRFSLSGLAAALLWIDEKQNRVGRSKDISNPAGIEEGADIATSEETKVKLSKLAEPFCSKEDQREIASYHLPDKDVLHAVKCFVDLKNTATVFFWENSAGISHLLFADYEDGWTGANTLPNAAFDPKTGFLQSSSISWGMDWMGCEYEGAWVWSDMSFKLLEFKYVADCEKGRPEDAKVLYKRPIN